MPTSIAMEGDIAEMERMLNEYLDFARGGAGETAADTDLAVLAAEAVADAGRAANAQRIALCCSTPDALHLTGANATR